jgi:hypothetical protein
MLAHASFLFFTTIIKSWSSCEIWWCYSSIVWSNLVLFLVNVTNWTASLYNEMTCQESCLTRLADLRKLQNHRSQCLDITALTFRLLLTSKLGSMLLSITSDNKMTKKNKGAHLKTLLFLDIYRIQILQNITQLSSKGRFNQSSLFLIHWNFGSN